MSEQPAQTPAPLPRGAVYRLVSAVGDLAAGGVSSVDGAIRYMGGLGFLLADALTWTYRGLFTSRVKFGFPALRTQMIRVGVKSISIVAIVEVFIGMILALQLAPTLQSYGQLERVADVVGIAIVRELGPLLTGIVLSGFAGASIAAEIGSMVESEEIKALRAHALDPIRFLVMPRILATTIMIVALTVMADFVGVLGGFLTSVFVLDVPPFLYLQLTQDALVSMDLITGLFKSAVFGVMIAAIACYEGLRVSGGAEGVGRATTATVVKSIVALIGIDAIFTTVFYALGI